LAETFEIAIKEVLHHEGGFVNMAEDPGGMTNKGITKRVYEKWIGREASEQEMRDLTEETAIAIYKKNYWDRNRCDMVEDASSPGVAYFLLDFAVNAGRQGAKCLQRAIGAEADGVIGPKTVALLKKMDADYVLEQMHKHRQSFYESLKTFKTFGRGWTRRNDEALAKGKKMAG
tara:strand:+ start:120 stop:641 length:522 start_codon:yes stop_codon:yes gene_type:complete